VRVLLDECVPQRLGRLLTGHDVTTAPRAGLAGIKNGELLRRAAGRFEVLLTVDRNLSFQQDVQSLPLAVVVMYAPSNRLEALRPLVPAMLALLGDALSPAVYHVGQGIKE